MACAICEARKPRRYCPGVRDDICSLCCGTEREVSVYCPLDCPYLQEARKHERTPPADPDKFPNQDIRVSEEFLRDHEELLVAVAQTLLRAAHETAGTVDNDIREALDALIRTYRTLESGVYYETRPNNPVAANICYLVQQGAAQFRTAERERLGMSRTRDTDLLGVLAFLQRLEVDRNNGRPRGRAYIDFLRTSFPGASAAARPAEGSPLIVP